MVKTEGFLPSFSARLAVLADTQPGVCLVLARTWVIGV